MHRYIASVMHKVRMLQHFGVTPYLVFDGDYLPSKAATEASRESSRNEKKKLAMELLRSGKQSQAMQEFQKCIDVTPEMASALIQHLKKKNIPYVVAPYEADAQLVYLERQGLIQGILSEDSDLLVFGAKCLLTKLDQYGNCIEIRRQDFCRCREVSLTGWSDTEFRRMAIMSGCDYLPGLPSVGLKTAYRLLRKSKDPERCVKMIQFQGKRVSENYLTQFYQAELTFLHQWVFCPTKQELVHLTDLDGTRTAEEMPFIGKYIEPEQARAIARGDLHPMTRLPIRQPTTPSKRRHSQVGATATPSLPAKPISSWFKDASRIPMGAMDPNCFSVDPEQVAAITHGGLLPRVFPLPRPYLHESQGASTAASPSRAQAVRRSPRIQRRRTEPIGDMLSRVANGAHDRQRRVTQCDTGLPPEHAASGSGPVRPQKKARLCEEAEVNDISPKQSKFFSAGTASSSRRKSNTTLKAKTDVNLLRSDDSLEEALSQLPDIGGWKAEPGSRKSFQVLDESFQQSPPDASLASNAISQDTSQDTACHSAQSESQQGYVSQTTAPSSPEPAIQQPTKQAPIGSTSLRTPAQFGLQKFSYSSASTSSTVASSRRVSSVFSAASTPSTAPSTGVSTRLTPLQRLGAKAINVSPHVPAYARQPKRKSFLDNLPVNPTMVALPKVDLDEVEALNKPMGGSEDMLVPENDDDINEEVSAPRKLDLTRFAYV